MAFTDGDMREQLNAILDACEGDYDFWGMLHELQKRYGVVSLDEIPGDDFARILGDYQYGPGGDR